MKISQLLASILVLLAGGAAIMYSSDQQKVMDVLIASHGGGQQVDASSATGLRKLNLDLDAERGTISSERAAAVKAAEAARVEMTDSNVKRNEAQAKLDEHKEALDGVRRNVQAMKKKAAEPDPEGVPTVIAGSLYLAGEVLSILSPRERVLDL